MAAHPRVILPAFLSLNLCKELEFIHKSCSTLGHRSNLFSTTLSHLIATDCAHLILPFVAIRERLKEKAEEFFGCEFELFIEFTGLISWTSGAKIGWHSDDNRPYLKQRDFAAVCYLNSYGKDFKGGLFHFLEGEPATIVPMAGDAIIYTADSRNIHSVDEIISGERLTLTLWFTRDSFHSEDARLVSLFSERLLRHQDGKPDSPLPMPASNIMYWFSPDPPHQHLGFDIRWARIHILRYNFCSGDEVCDSASDSPNDPLELLNMPLRLVGDDLVFGKEFANSLHALQVVQFYHWKGFELQASNRVPETGNGVRLVQPLDGQKPIIPASRKLLRWFPANCLVVISSLLSIGLNCLLQVACGMNMFAVYIRSCCLVYHPFGEPIRTFLLYSFKIVNNKFQVGS